MPKRQLAALLATLALGASGVASAADLPPDPHRFDGVRKLIEMQRKISNLAGVSVAVAQGGKIVWEEGFGFADKDRKIPATADTIYSLASITKPITGAGLMVLVERGKIDLDKPINDYLGAAKLVAHVGDARDATVRRVANHTAGLPLHYQFFYEDEPVAKPSMDESIRRYGHLMTAPGERMEYSNFGYGVLDYVIARTSTKSYAEFIRDEVYLPLGMTSSSINRSPDFGDRVARRYTPGGDLLPFYDFDHQGASAAFTSAHDLVRFGMFFLGDKVEGQRPIISEAGVREMLRPTAVDQTDPTSSRGVAWGIETVNGVKTINHNGGMAGVSTSLYLIPEHDVVVVVLANGTVQTSALVAPILMSLMPNEHRAKVYAPDTGLVGAWRGRVATHDGVVPLALNIADGAAMMTVGSAPPQNVNAQLDDEGLLQIQDVKAAIGSKDAARYPYKLTFKLKPRGKVLNGSVAAVSDWLPKRLGNALSYWVELEKVDAVEARP